MFQIIKVCEMEHEIPVYDCRFHHCRAARDWGMPLTSEAVSQTYYPLWIDDGIPANSWVLVVHS